MDEARGALRVYFLTKASDLDVDDVVERCGTARFSPDLPGEHFTRDEMALMAEEVFEQLELSRGQIEQPVGAVRPTGHQIQLQVGGLQPEDFRRPAAAQERPDAREQLGQCEWLDEIVVGATVETEYAVVDAVARRENEDRRLDTALPQSLQDFQTAAPRQHQIENDEVKRLGVGPIEAVLSGGSDGDFVVLPFQRRSKNPGDLPFVLDDENPHQRGMLPGQALLVPDFCVRN